MLLGGSPIAIRLPSQWRWPKPVASGHSQTGLLLHRLCFRSPLPGPLRVKGTGEESCRCDEAVHERAVLLPGLPYLPREGGSSLLKHALRERRARSAAGGVQVPLPSAAEGSSIVSKPSSPKLPLSCRLSRAPRKPESKHTSQFQKYFEM